MSVCHLEGDTGEEHTITISESAVPAHEAHGDDLCACEARQNFYFDADLDGFGDASSSVLACSAPAGYVTDATDCDDSDAAINPSAAEVCNDVDDDCDQLIDDADPTISGQSTWFADADGDLYGDAASSMLSCDQPAGHLDSAGDCDDSDGSVNPGATEECDGIDNNCDSLVDTDASGNSLCQITPTALVWSTGNSDGKTTQVGAWLYATGLFSAVDAVDSTNLPLSTLLNYDVVMFFTNHGGDPTSNGNVLADFADTGRRLVVATFAYANQGSNTLSGRFISGGYSPVTAVGGSLYSYANLGVYDASSPFFSGVSTVRGYYRDNVKLNTGATLYGSWSDGRPLLARKANVVAVNLFPDDSFGTVSGDYRRLFANALTAP